MYLLTVFGFFAVCRKEDGELQVRARIRGDMECLLASTMVDCEIEETPGREYPFRIAVSERELGIILDVLQESVSYPSFRKEIAGREDQSGKLPACEALLRSLPVDRR